jgi:hypothetical protein
MLRRRSKLMIAIVACVLGATAASAYAVVSRSSSPASPAPSAKWHWASVPGQSITPTPAMADFAAQSGVTTSSIRQVVSSATGLSLVAGTDATGRVCTAQAGGAVASASNFHCLNPWTDRFAMILYSTEGGAKPGIADHASVVGLTRPDVAQVAVTTAQGTVVNLALNQWGGFSYDATTTATIPASIAAFDSSGHQLDQSQLYPAS